MGAGVGGAGEGVGEVVVHVGVVKRVWDALLATLKIRLSSLEVNCRRYYFKELWKVITALSPRFYAMQF